MDKPHLHAIINEALYRDKSNDIVYRKFGCLRKTQEGQYYDTNGMIIKDPIRVFRINNLPKFPSMDAVFAFLLKLDYERWKYATHDKDFIMHHYDLVKEMYLPEDDMQKKLELFIDSKRILDSKLANMKALFIRLHKKELITLKDLHYELYGDV